jgi:hypothetical protein
MKYLLFILLCVSCGDDGFRKVEKLEGFRILGIVADKSEVDVLETANLRVLIADVNGVSTTLDGSYVACVDPGISRGAEATCETLISAGDYDINMGDLPALSGRVGTGPIINIDIPDDILIGKSTLEKFNGVAVIVIFNFTINGVNHSAYKRIVATDGSRTRNTVPTGSAILLNNQVIASAPNDGDNLSVTTSAAETYEVMNVDGSKETLTEKYEIAWYTNSGKFDLPKAKIDEVVEYQGDTASTLTIAVIRDERGGLDFVKAYFP